MCLGHLIAYNKPNIIFAGFASSAMLVMRITLINFIQTLTPSRAKDALLDQHLHLQSSSASLQHANLTACKTEQIHLKE